MGNDDVDNKKQENFMIKMIKIWNIYSLRVFHKDLQKKNDGDEKNNSI